MHMYIANKCMHDMLAHHDNIPHKLCVKAWHVPQVVVEYNAMVLVNQS